MEMGSFIKQRREALGFSQAELSRQADIKQPSLFAIENGTTRDLKCSTLIRLADALKVSPLTILAGVDVAVDPAIDSLRMETELVRLFRSLNGSRRLSLIEYARYLLEAQPKVEAPAPIKIGGKLHQLPREARKGGLR